MGFKIVEDRPTPKEVYGWRVYTQALLAATGALLFGYDSGQTTDLLTEFHSFFYYLELKNASFAGFFGSTISLPSFTEEFGFAQMSSSHKLSVTSNLTSSFQLGALAGSLIFFPFTEFFGRKIVLQVSGVLFQLGAGIQLYPTGERGLAAMYAGRAIAGIALGGITLTAPLYLAEISPPGIRGRIVGLYEIAYQLGAVVGFFINYGVTEHVPSSRKQWHIPVGVQLAYGGVFLIATLFLVETPRYLQKRNEHGAAAKQLSFLRNLPEDHEYVQEELRATRASIEHEQAVLKTGGWRGVVKEMLMKGNRNRLWAGVCVMWFQNLTGINAVNYYSPTIFRSLGMTGTSGTLLGTGIYGVVKAMASIVFLIFLVDRVKRRHALMLGGSISCAAMIYIFFYLHFDDPAEHTGSRPPQGTLAIVMIYVYVVSYCASWNGLAWIIPSEIFPLRIRVPCLAITTASQWAGQFTITRSTPYMLEDLKAFTYLFFAICLVCAVLWAKFVLLETSGYTLEQMDEVWGFVPSGPIVYHSEFAHDLEKATEERREQVEDADFGQKSDS